MKLLEIPYLRQFPTDGRIAPLVTHFDGIRWHSYFETSPGDFMDLALVEMVSGIYLAERPARETDMELLLATFLFQRRPAKGAFSAYQVLANDLENSLTSLHKQFILFSYYEHRSDTSHSTVISAELEYALLNYRSVYDLLNDFVDGFIKAFNLSKNELPSSFADVLKANEDTRARYGFTQQIWDFYQSKKDRFLVVRDLRDSVAHHGKETGIIFKLPTGFGIDGRSFIGEKLKQAGLWDKLKPAGNDIGSCLAFLAFLSDDLFGALSTLTRALTESVPQLPPETAPGYRIYARSALAQHRVALADYLTNPWRMGPTQ